MEGILTLVVLLINVSVVQLISNEQEVSKAKLHVQDGIRGTELGKRNEELSFDISGAEPITGTSSLKTYRSFYQSCSVENENCFGQIENSSVRKHNEDNKHEDTSEYIQPNLLRNGRNTDFGGQPQGAQDKQGTRQIEAHIKENSGRPGGKHLKCSDADYACFKNHMLPDVNSNCQVPLSICSTATTIEWWVADEKLYSNSNMLRAVCIKKPCPPGEYMNQGKCIQALAMCKDMNTFFDVFGVVHCHTGTKPPKNMADFSKAKKNGNKCDVSISNYAKSSAELFPPS